MCYNLVGVSLSILSTVVSKIFIVKQASTVDKSGHKILKFE